MTHQLEAAHPTHPAHPAPPDPPELPEGVERGPRWPAWYSIVGFVAGLLGTVLLGAIFGLVATLLGADVEGSSSLVVVGGTLLQYVAFTAAAVGFAFITLRPRAWHFGFRRTRFWWAVLWGFVGFVTIFLFTAVYSAILRPEDQNTLDTLGVDEGQGALFAAAALVIVVAPIAEEFFFRGFFYRALRTSLPIWAAVLIDGLLFGSIHFTSGVEAVPPLIVIGIVFCLLFEVTGSLYPPIALHAVNNMLAFMVGTEEVLLSLALGLGTVAACMIVPRVAWRAAPAAAR
jgi:uncharacterized protein